MSLADHERVLVDVGGSEDIDPPSVTFQQNHPHDALLPPDKEFQLSHEHQHPGPSRSPAPMPDTQKLQEKADYIRILRISGFQFSWRRELLYWLAVLFSGGIVGLLCYWFQRRSVRYRYDECEDLSEAEYVFIEAADGGYEFLPIERIQTQPRAYHPSLCGKLWYGPSRINDPSRPHSYIPTQERMFLFRHHRFFLHPNARPARFVKQVAMTHDEAGSLVELMQKGLTVSGHAEKQRRGGINQVQIIVPSYPALLLKEVFHPFFIFQIYSVILWIFEEYYWFALCIFVIAAVSIVTTLRETRSSLINLSKVARFDVPVTVLRREDDLNAAPRVKEVMSSDLTPGDIIGIIPGIVPCDVAIMQGGAVVNEAMLTGESTPVIKTCVQMPLDATGRNKHHPVALGSEPRSTLYAATRVLQCKPAIPGQGVWGVVVRTGYSTSKGSLILSILYPKPSSFAFEKQSYKFIGGLFILSLIGFGISIWQLKLHDAAIGTMFIRGLDLITIVVPPSLPLALSVGTNFALIALKRRRIYCISPNRINLAGKIQFMCFDKTGTLTSEGMEMKGVLQCNKDTNFDPFMEINHHTESSNDADMSKEEAEFFAEGIDGMTMTSEIVKPRWSVASDSVMPISPVSSSSSSSAASGPGSAAALSADVLTCMSCCHALAEMEGELIGDPLEIEIFKASQARLHDAARDGYVCFVSVAIPTNGADPASPSRSIEVEMGIAVQFEFVPSLQRMSVIVENQSDDSDIRVVCKGSPEMIQRLCRPETLPKDFDRMMRIYAAQGYRVIAMAQKSIDSIPQLEKEELRRFAESDLQFLGMLILENKVKRESAPTIATLHQALIRSVIVTGDTALTAINVSRQCGIVDSTTRIFLAQLVDDVNGTRIEWRDSNAGVSGDGDESMALTLDPHTLAITAPAGVDKTQIHGKYELAITGSVFKHLEEAHLAYESSRGLASADAAATRRYMYNDAPLADGTSSLNPTAQLHRILLNCVVFSRFAPEQKASLISHLQSLGIYTGMCGDGANDSNALKAAHAGVSLSESEASIAAPFTYARPNISCIPMLLSEGRSSLVTAFSLFKYMSLYSCIQFTAVILCYFRGTVLGNWEYLYHDLFVVFPLTVLMGGTPANPKLSIKRPSGNLLSFLNLTAVIIHMLICGAFQYIIFFLTPKQSDYDPTRDEDNGPVTYDSNSLYLYSVFQYIVVAVLFARAQPWKAAIWKNKKFTAWVIIGTGVSLALLLSNDRRTFFREEEVSIEFSWRAIMLLFAIADASVHCLFSFLLYPVFVRRYKSWSKRRYRVGSVYGKVKNIEGPTSKTYHRIRGEFEQMWTRETIVE